MEKTSRRSKRYLSIEPSKESMKTVREKIKSVTKINPASNEEVAEKVNRILRGWQQYFDNIAIGKTRGVINTYAKVRMMKMISRRNKRNKVLWKMFKNDAIHRKYGLYNMKNLNRKFV